MVKDTLPYGGNTTDPIIIQIICDAAGLPCSEEGAFVMEMDFEAMEGYGHLVATRHPSKAKQFATPEEAMRFYQTAPACHPLRSDGKPNRPMTAYTVEFLRYHPHRNTVSIS